METNCLNFEGQMLMKKFCKNPNAEYHGYNTKDLKYIEVHMITLTECQKHLFHTVNHI
jgi:hypothetical protein